MRKNITLLFSLLLIGIGTLRAQVECDGTRYAQEVFPNLDVTTDLTYGANYDYLGNNITLKLDVYEPQGDTVSLRPLIVWSHGGSFVGGSKDQGDVVAMTEPFARMGYVCASIQYRIGMPIFGVDSVAATEAVLRGVHDAKAAIRYFYKDVRENGNTYRIDTNRIFLGGVSAGAFIALHYAYLDQMSEFPSYIDTMQNGLGGGLHGTSGNPGYSEEIKGVINICGALKDTAYMHSGDLPLVSLHGPDDQVVPYGSSVLSLLFTPIIEVDGSSSVHARAVEEGIPTCFYTYEGAGHVPHVGSAAYTDTTVNIIKNYIYQWACGTGGSCGYSPILSNTPTVNREDLKIWPNPAQDQVNLQMPEAQGESFQVHLLDLSGRMIREIPAKSGETIRIQRESLSSGVYFVRVQGPNRLYTGKVIFQ